MKMSPHILSVLPALLLAAACTWAQDSLPRRSEPGMKIPSDPGMSRPHGTAEKPAAPSGMVVVPPKTDPEAVATPPANVDPGIKTPPPKGDSEKSSGDSQGEDGSPAQHK